MRRFFIDTASLQENELVLPVDESKHVGRVLRMKTGDHLEIVNGKGMLFQGEIIDDNPKRIVVKKIDLIHQKPDAVQLHIAIAPTKQNDRIEWFLEKATELGIHEITPILCQNSERKKIKLERYQRVLVAAVKQSKRLYIPILHPLTTMEDFIEQHQRGFIAHCYDDAIKNKGLFNVLKEQNNQKIRILIGPEGDFSKKEIELALQAGYQAITLGQTRLRTETAGVHATSIAKLFFETI